MATEAKARWRGNRTPEVNAGRSRRLRVLTAAATRVHADNKREVDRLRAVRQTWQLDAFTYRNTIGELRYATNYLANAVSRMRLFVAALPDSGESDMPVDLRKTNAPPELIAACDNAMRDFGNGRTAIAGHLRAASTNFTLAGEAYLLGQMDVLTGRQTWSIRSVSEVAIYEGELGLREGPMDATGALGLTPLDEYSTVVRMWQPDPQFRLLADSPVKALLNECESLLILRRNIRAVGRSRLAGRGLLLWPDELSIAGDVDDNGDPESDPVMDELMNSMMTPIGDEGDASAVVPTVVRGPGDILQHIRLVDLSSNFDELAGKTRDELVGVIATGLDLPKEVILGMTDLNHWTAWAVDDNTFRNHIEPHVITITDAFTDAYLRPYIATSGLAQPTLDEWLPRLLFWYDPTELVTHPDQMANATLLHNSLALSDATYRAVAGFSEEDAPSAEEIELRMVRTTRTYPPNLLMALMHELDPSLTVPAMTGPPALPGINPETGATAPVPPSVGATPVTPSAATDSQAAPSTAPASIAGAPAVLGPPPSPAVTAAGIVRSLSAKDRELLLRVIKAEFYSQTGVRVRPVTAAGKVKVSDKAKRLSRKATAIDAELRTKLITAANAAMLRQLEKAGGRVRNKVAANETMRTAIAQTRNEHVMAQLGRGPVEATGLTASVLMVSEWETLEAQFRSWTEAAQKQSIALIARMVNIDEGTAWASADVAMRQGVDRGWNVLRGAMDTLALHLPFNPDPNISTADHIASLNPDTLVPSGVIRAALGVAGGADESLFGMVTTKSGASVPAIPLGQPVGGIATGATVSSVAKAAGASTAGYEWVHGPSDKPFQPHEDLDGREFVTFDDPVLANEGTFPDNQFYMPGDHAGCLCDVTPLWVTDQDVTDAQNAADAADAAMADA